MLPVEVKTKREKSGKKGKRRELVYLVRIPREAIAEAAQKERPDLFADGGELHRFAAYAERFLCSELLAFMNQRIKAKDTPADLAGKVIQEQRRIFAELLSDWDSFGLLIARFL